MTFLRLTHRPHMPTELLFSTHSQWLVLLRVENTDLRVLKSDGSSLENEHIFLAMRAVVRLVEAQSNTTGRGLRF